MDEQLRRAEREESIASRLRAWRRAGRSEEEVWSELATDSLAYSDVLELARGIRDFQFLEVTRQACGGLEGETGRFLHRVSGLVFRLIPGGRFLMGSPDELEIPWQSPRHEVRLSPFFLCETVCTQWAWDRLAGLAQLDDERTQRGELLPITGVNWEDAWEWCDWTRLRLPSEAEWEYACRAGSEAAFCFGEDTEELRDYAWFDQNADEETHDVGLLRPNCWGLHDMHGNVREMCADDWSKDYTGAPTTGWPPAKSKRFRSSTQTVLRGGSWVYTASQSSSDHRFKGSLRFRYQDIGFRPARSYQLSEASIDRG